MHGMIAHDWQIGNLIHWNRLRSAMLSSMILFTNGKEVLIRKIQSSTQKWYLQKIRNGLIGFPLLDPGQG